MIIEHLVILTVWFVLYLALDFAIAFIADLFGKDEM